MNIFHYSTVNKKPPINLLMSNVVGPRHLQYRIRRQIVQLTFGRSIYALGTYEVTHLQITRYLVIFYVRGKFLNYTVGMKLAKKCVMRS